MDIRLIRDILYNRNQAGLIALSQFLLKNHREITYGKFSGKLPSEIAFMKEFMFSVEKVAHKDSEIMNDMMAVLPNFIFTFGNGLREFLDGPFLHELENITDDILLEILVQLSFVYEIMDRKHVKTTGKQPVVKLLYRDRDLSYRFIYKNQAYKIKPTFLAIIPNLNIGDLRSIHPNIAVTGSPLDNLMKLVGEDSKVKTVFDKIVEKIDPYVPILESPKYILAKINGSDGSQVLDGIAACVSSKPITDYESSIYYSKMLSTLPSNPNIDAIIKTLKTGQFTTKNRRLLEIIRKPLISGVCLEKLSERYIDDLLPISTDPETMKYIGRGEVWTREKLLEKVVPSDVYYNWVILNNDNVVGYAGLHPMINSTNVLQMRVFIGKNYRGKGIGVEAVKIMMEKQYTEIPFKILGVVNNDNVASIRMMEKAGLKKIGEIKIRGNLNNVYGTEQKAYNDIFIIDHDVGFQYEKLKIKLSNAGIKPAVRFSARPKFNWGSLTYCEMNSCLDGSEFVTDQQRLYHAVSKYFPDVPLPNKTTTRTMKVYMVVSILNGKFSVYVWNKADYKSHTVNDINIFLTNETSTQLRVILTAVSELLYKSSRVSKKSKWGFQLYTVDIAIYPDTVDLNVRDTFALLGVSRYNEYQYGTAGLSYSDSFFDWLNECVFTPFITNGQSSVKALYENTIRQFGFYGMDYSSAIAELPDLINYPYLYFYTRDSDIIGYFETLKTYKYTISDQPYSFHNIPMPADSIKFRGKYHRIISTKAEGRTIGSMSDYFTEDIRVHCKFLSNLPIYQYYNENFTSLISTLRSENKPANIDELRELLWRHKQCTTFKPKIIRYIIGMFKARKVLDISSGWGDRLIGAMASDIDFYHGFDPNPKLAPRYMEIINFFKPFAVNPAVVCSVETLPFELAELNPGFYDLVMSSPPYFTMEVYDPSGEGQSIGRNPSEIDWYRNFLAIWVRKCKMALRQGGIMALNINQEKGRNYVNWFLSENISQNSGFAFLGTIGYSNEDGRNPQPIFVFQKI